MPRPDATDLKPFATPADPFAARRRIAMPLARALFAAAVALGLSGAALYAWLPMALAPSMRELLVGACLGFAAVTAGGLYRLSEANVRSSVVGLGWLVLPMVGVLAVGLGEGVGSLNNGYLIVAVCMVAVLADRRAALLLGAGALLLALALAGIEAAGWLPGGPAPARRPLGVRLLSLTLVLATGSLVAALISDVIGRQLREVERQARNFGALLRVAADWYWELDADLRYSKFAEETPGASGLDPLAAIGSHPWELAHGLSDDELDALRADLEARRPIHQLVTRRPGRDGHGVHFVSASAEPRFDDGGRFTGYWGVGRDITDEVRVRQARDASETRYRELFDRSPSALFLHRNGVVIAANPAATRLFGYPDGASAVGHNLLDHYHEADAHARTQARLERMAQLPIGAALPVEDFVLRSHDGRVLNVRVSSVRVDAADGPAALTLYEDLTERRAAENALRSSQALLSKVLATSPDLIALSSARTGRFVLVNDSFTQLLGWRADEVIGRTSLELGTWARPEDGERLLQAISRGPVQDMSMEFVAKSGARVPMLVSAAHFAAEGRDYVVINARDVRETERVRLEREVIFDTASVGIAFTRDRRFAQANPRFEQMFGWAIGSLAGQPGRIVWPSDAEYAEIGATLGPRLARGEQVEVERPMRRRDGSVFWCRLLAKAVDPNRPGAGGTVWIAEDITERRAFEQALAQARDAAEAASRAKSAFLANTSHELRTPLNGLLGLARLAQQPELDAARRQRYIEQIADSAQSLSDIIADILDLSKIEAGKLTIEAVPFDPAATVRSLHRAYLELARARGLTLTLDVADDVPELVRGDPVRTRQILSNYVANALKFTARGGVHIELSRSADGALRLAVLDTGPGIDPAIRERLFHPFTQADDSTTRRFGGTGLGLSICRQLATLMGGTVGVDSEPGRGSLFWAELPLPASDDGDAVSGFGGLDERPLAGAHVLVVEDNAVNMMICVALLEQQGLRIGQATNGREAIEAVDRALRDGDPFDAVLMDVQMPEMGGHEATRVLRQRHDAGTLPIIALTAAALVSEREQALAAGMNDFLTKPIEPRRLLRALAKVLGQPA